MRALALGASLLLIAAAPPALVLREQAWHARARDMTHAPRECLAEGARGRADVELGRALFRAPILLGGPAARVGLSCNSCHANGRANSAFLLPELTDRAGHADVTSEWASAVRGDGIANPVLIPDLAGVGAKTRFGSRGEPSLEIFVRGVIVEEFQGAPPPAPAFAAVIAYLRALEMCAGEDALTPSGAAGDVRRSLFAARAQRDAAAASLGLAAAQDAVGRMVERLPARTFADERRRLELLARELGAARGNVARLPASWVVRFDAVAARAERKAGATYFNEAVLMRDLGE